jgi:hypothetical protein
MKKLILFSGLATGMLMLVSTTALALDEGSPIDPCINCHDVTTPAIVKQWQASKHSMVGVKCYVCHQAKEGDPSGMEHHGFTVTAVVSPNYCEGCHAKQVEEFKQSMHDEAGLFSLNSYGIVGEETVRDNVVLGQTRNYQAHFSRESAEAGCLDCHGTVIEVGKDGKLINWPNMGIGRFNPDGSVGTCAACHTRHTFSIEQARKPETCGQCHLGPDHPQREIFEESKHGNLVAANGEHYNWSAPPGQWGPDDIEAPTCATCHMSGFGGAVESTHNVSARLKWELEPVFSWPTDPKYLAGKEKYPIDPQIAARYEKIHDLPKGSLKEVATGGPNPFADVRQFAPEIYEAYVGPGKWWEKGETRLDSLGGDAVRPSDAKREDMLAVCNQCHVRSWSEGDLKKADAMIDVYNAVVLAIKVKYYDPIKKEKLDEDVKFNGNSEVDNLWHEVWHHEGRIWRMGGFMQGQDWQHWEGAYEIADDGSHLADWYEKLKLRKAVKEKLGIK